MGMRKTPSDISCFLYAPVECRLVRTKAKTAPAPKPYRIGHLFTGENSDFDAVSVMMRSCAAPRRSGKRIFSYIGRFWAFEQVFIH